MLGPLVLAALALPAGAADEELDLVKDFERTLRREEGYARVVAVGEFSEATRALEDGGASRRVAKALEKALEDDDLEVRGAAVDAFSWGRHVDVTLNAFEDLIDDLIGEIDKRSTRPDAPSRAYVRDGTRVLEDAAVALANYRDDRAVEILADRLVALRSRGTLDAADFHNRASVLLSRGLLRLGSREAVEAVITRARALASGIADGVTARAARALHDELAAFSLSLGVAPPDFSEQFDQAWYDWFGDREDVLPARLGRLDEPPRAPPEEAGRRVWRARGPGARPPQD